MIQSNIAVRLTIAGVTALLAAAMLVPSAQAQAPAPGYEDFAGCPSPAEKPNLTVCLFSEITGGHLQMGSKDVTIQNPLTLSGGAEANFENFSYNSKGGLSKTPQKVPGGVIGLTGLTWLLEFFGSDALTLYATTELAGVPSNFTPASVTIPIKVRLTTPSGVIGNSCYIGSNSNPITLNFITGTTSPPPPNEPITGVNPELHYDAEREVVQLVNGTYVDNSFAVPGASGCVLKLFGFIPISLNSFVNSQGGLPSPAGKNEAVQDFNLEFTERTKVYP